MNYLVTGGLGYVGSWLAKKLLDDGHNVLIFDNASARDLKTYDKAKTVLEKYRKCNIVIKDAFNLMGRDLIGIDCIFHLAGVSGVDKCERDIHGSRLNNVKLTKKVMQLASECKIKRVVFTSTAAVYGKEQNCREIWEHNWHGVVPENRYAMTKQKAESIVLIEPNVTGIVARLSNVYGMGYYDKDTVISHWVREAFKDENLVLYGNGDQVRDFIHLDDVVDALIHLSDIGKEEPIDPKEYLVFNVGTGKTTPVDKAGEMILKECKSRNPFKLVKTQRIEPQPGYKYDVSRLKDFGWTAKIKLSQGIKRLIKRIHDEN